MSRDWKNEESFGFEKDEDNKNGPPEVLQLDELPLPRPDKGEVRLRVKAIGLNRAEIHFRQGRRMMLEKPALEGALDAVVMCEG